MKKVLALTLALVLALGMSTVAFAKFEKDDWMDRAGFAASAGGAFLADGDEVEDIEVGPDANLYTVHTGYYLTTDLGDVASPGKLNKNVGGVDFRGLNIKFNPIKGGSVIDEVKLDTDGEVLIVFKKNVMTVKDVAWKVTVSGMIADRAKNEGKLTFSGTYLVKDDDTEDNYYDFEDNDCYLKTSTYIRDMEFVLGEGVSVFGRALKGVAYKGKATIEPTDADEKLMFEHPEIVNVYRLDTIGIKNVAEKVKLNNEAGDLIVYDSNFNRLGKSNEDLPYSDVYYLAASELDIDSDDMPEDDDEDDDEYEIGWGDNSGTGGDDLYPENPHDNPGTGK